MLIPLFGKDGIGKYAIIDDMFTDTLGKYKYFYANYTCRGPRLLRVFRNSAKTKSMILLVTDVIGERRMVVTHKNGDYLDHRMDNLDIGQNLPAVLKARSDKTKTLTSQHEGVVWDYRMNAWRAQYKKPSSYPGVEITRIIGYFQTEEKAVNALSNI